MPTPSLPWWAFALGSAFFAALTTLFARLGVAGVSSNLATAIRTAVVLVLAWLIVAATGELRPVRDLPARTWLWLVLSGFATGASWLCYFRALQVGTAAAVASVDKSSLAMIVLLAALFLGEPLTLRTALGAGLIVAGTLVFVL